MTDTLTELQRQHRDYLERCRSVNHAKARRVVRRVAEEEQWSPDDITMILESLRIQEQEEE